MTTQEIEFSRVNAAAYNPREDLQPGDPEWKDIEASLDEFGQVLNLVWNKRTGNMVAGHQRMRVMQHKGRDRATFCVVDLDTDAEKKLNLILNRVTGRWNTAKLQTVLSELRVANVPLERLGWNPIELKTIFGENKPKPKRDPDAKAPAKPVAPVTKTGDIYELTSQGRIHRVMCGDSENAEDLARLMNGQKARVIFTDPPYGVEYDNSQRGDGRRPLGAVLNDELRDADLYAFLCRIYANAATVGVENPALYTFFATKTHMEFEAALRATGWRVKQELVWRKHFALSRAHYHWAHEPFFYAERSGHGCEWFGPRTQTTIADTTDEEFEKWKKEDLLRLVLEMKAGLTVWDEARDAGAGYVHPTQKPIRLAVRAALNSAKPGEILVDLFGGSGSTLVGAETEGRVCYTNEKDPGYVDVIVRRFLETFEATATRNGEPFAIA